MKANSPNNPPTPACRICHGTRCQLLFFARDFWLKTPGEFTVFLCLDCGIHFIDPIPHDLGSRYPNTYYSFTRRTQPKHQSFLKRLSQRHKDHKVMATIPTPPHPNGRAIDIGCGAGDFLGRMQAKGWDAYGVEPFSGGLEARKQGLAVFHGELLDAGYPDGHFHFIRLRHVLEHLPEPLTILREIARIAAPGCLLSIAVPNAAGLNARLFGRYWHQLDAPRHLFGYNAPRLTALLAQHGFYRQELLFEKSYMGTSVRYLLEEKAPAWLTGKRWQLIQTGLKLTRPFTSLVARFGLGDEFTLVAKKSIHPLDG